MKRRSASLELRALASILDSKAPVRNRVLSEARPDHFGHAPARECFERVHTYIQNNRPVPSSRELARDPAISKRARLFLRSGMSPKQSKHPARLRGSRDISAMVSRLELYRQQRLAYDMAKRIGEEISEEHPNHDELWASLEHNLLDARSATGAEIFHAGQGANEDVLFDSIINDDTPLEIIPTGLATFDEHTGGLARTNLVFLAANYGGGKSVAGQQLGLNMYRLGYNVLWVSLEMDENEAWERIWANVAGVAHADIRRRRLTSKQKRILASARKDFLRHGRTRKCRFSTYHPGHVGPWQLSSQIRGYNYDVVIVDYINLLKPPPGTPNEERIQLGETAKALKLVAGKRYLNAVMIVLAQLNDDNRLKYSRAMAEHANNVLWWRMDDRARERGEVLVHQDKARNARLYDFFIKHDFEHMTMSDGGLAEDRSNIKRKRDASSETPRKEAGAREKRKEKGSKKRKQRKKQKSGRRSAMPELTQV